MNQWYEILIKNLHPFWSLEAPGLIYSNCTEVYSLQWNIPQGNPPALCQNEEREKQFHQVICGILIISQTETRNQLQEKGVTAFSYFFMLLQGQAVKDKNLDSSQ